MMKKLLKNYLFAVALLVASFGFAQEPVLTIVGVTPPATVVNGAPATFDIQYTIANYDVPIVSTFAFYLRAGNFRIGGFPPITYTGASGTTQITFTWPASGTVDGAGTQAGQTKTLVSTSVLPMGDNYELRFFNSGTDKTDFDFANPASMHFTSPTGLGTAGGTSPDGFLANFVTINYPAASTEDVNNKPVLYVSQGQLNVSKAADYKIYSITGAVVAQGKASRTIDINALSSGLYIYKTLEGTAKFVK